jgi:hypothetical protein
MWVKMSGVWRCDGEKQLTFEICLCVFGASADVDVDACYGKSVCCY